MWWNYDAVGDDTREVCWGYGYDIETIDIDVIINVWIEECYKSIFSNLEEPFAGFADFFTWECSASTTQDVNFYVEDLYDSDDSKYTVGAEPDPDTQEAATESYCTDGLFSSNTVFNSAFDLALNYSQKMGSARNGMEKPAKLAKKIKSSK